MKKLLIAILLALNSITVSYAQTALLHYQPGARLIDGSQLNKMVDQVNNLTGHGTAGAIAGTTLTLSGNATIGGTLGVTGVTTFTAIPIAPATGITLGSTTFSEATLALYTKGVAAGYKIARGETALDGSNPTPVTTGLSTIVACTVSIKTTTAPGVSTSVVTYDTSSGTMNMYGWKPTGTGDTTLIASAGTDTIGWICAGT